MFEVYALALRRKSPKPPNRLGRQEPSGPLHIQPERDFRHPSCYENNDDQQRHTVTSPNVQELRIRHTFAFVCLGKEVLPTPSRAAGTEQGEFQSAQHQEVVGNLEVFQRLDVADAGNLHARPYRKAQNARQGKQCQQRPVDGNCSFARDIPLVHRKTQDVLEDRDNG